MKTSKIQEFVIIVITILPVIYLAAIYTHLPDLVPMHFNANGEMDRMGSKKELWGLVALLSLPMYLLFKYLPKLDPKKQLEKMGGKFYAMRLALTVFITAISLGIIYTTANYNTAVPLQPDWIFVLVGLLFIVVGNFMPAMKPNYFVGIRTPWTLENEVVWRKTHRIGAWAFILCGILITLSALLFSMESTYYVTMGTTFAMVAFVIIYSYSEFKKQTK